MHYPVEHAEFVKMTAESEKKKAEKALPKSQVMQTTHMYDHDSQEAKARWEKSWNSYVWMTSHLLWLKTPDFTDFSLPLTPATLCQ